MTDPDTAGSSNSGLMSWVLIALGVVVVALGLWNLLIERGGSNVGSMAAMVVGFIVIVRGLRRRRAGV